ncbi:alcohol dehydrogenase catalytic domain-containing protein [Sphaerisporangium sp. TRM90804]|uniref:alcohol dehydrogenase catalytic domain-containing protein n=1 Tax=Sphaerisporangium sp. TRM90804 TaxID=3031113 RepID=UPI00244B353B|nr:alcohol dehydrogenase catalytic domain-containing protein [Sphaerisporangium sp. TRM90804]MDH2427318.1 alcohol dehydrogenase catalytic domain-containing protein [Sphaerisporangium sp. TRM90804]
MTAAHRAIVRTAGTVALGTRPTAEPGPGELSLEVVVAGLCGTDIQMLRGLRDDGAAVIGHEGLARVVAAGPGAPFTPGTPVLVNPTHPADPSFLLGHNVDGLLQERVIVPATAVEGGMVLPLGAPETPEDALTALLEPLAVVHYALEIHRRFAPATLLVVGDGTVGHLAVRAARHLLGPVRVVHAHHTPAGLAWSRGGTPAADLTLLAEDLGSLPPAGGTVCVLLATPRDATLPLLERVLGLGEDTLVVDMVGGLPPGARTPLLPGVDLAAVRAANCGGIPAVPVVAEATTPAGSRVVLYGHRGVANRHLRAAARELTAFPGRYRALLTHETDLAGAVGVLRALAGSSGRVIEGRRLVKLAVRIGASETWRNR